MWVADIEIHSSQILIFSLLILKPKYFFHVPRHCIRAHSGISVHHGSEGNRTSCEVTDWAKHQRENCEKHTSLFLFFNTDFLLETQIYSIWNGFLLWFGFFLILKPFKVPLPSLKPRWSLMWENIVFFPYCFQSLSDMFWMCLDVSAAFNIAG